MRVDPVVDSERLDEEVRLLRILGYRTIRLRSSRLLSEGAKHVLGELCDQALQLEEDAERANQIKLVVLAQACGMPRERGSRYLTELERLRIVRVEASIRNTSRLPLRVFVTIEWRELAALLIRGDRNELRKAPAPAARGSRVA